MKKLGLLLGFLMVTMYLIRINIITSNRLLSDVVGYDTRLVYSDDSKKVNEALSAAKVDLYRDYNGYTNKEGNISIPNTLTKVETKMIFQSFNFPIINEPLFVRTDKGSILTGPFNNFEWNYDENMVEWDGTNHTYTGGTEGIEFRLFKLFITDDYDVSNEILTNIYNLTYYDRFGTVDEFNTTPLYLDGQVGILAKLKNNAVVGYTILNSNIEDWEYLSIFNLNCNRLVTVNKGNLQKMFKVGDTEDYEQVTGHLIELNFETAQKLSLEVMGHREIIVRTIFGEEIYNSEITNLNYDLGPGAGSIELEIYGTDLFQLDVDYQKTVKE